MISQKVTKAVAPAEAGAQNGLIGLDSRFRGNDEKAIKTIFYEAIKIQLYAKG